ncbi:MAG: hypothetical protein B6241_05340 [Spirochaetaceae bacterium 4572_59]|nr:MAG: hypothetical protein B6241_05340 [Spirochaetaceae bacterium 4572_59]
MTLYQKNTDALKFLFPGILKTLEESLSRESLASEEEYEFSPSKSGDVTLRIKGVFIHSRHYPQREAEKLIEREINEDSEYCLFYGFGLGYHIEAFHRRYPETLFAIIEPDTALFRQALKQRDFTSLIKSGKFNILLGSEVDGVTILLNTIKTSRIQTCMLRPVYLNNRGYYDKLDKTVRDFLTKREINTNTHRRFSRLWISNISKNVHLLGEAPAVQNIRNKFAGKPALLIAAGPGLTEILPHLAALREKLLLVCVDTALRCCLERGVEPDFTVLTDPQYWNTRHLDRCHLKTSILISDVSSYPTVFRQTEGPVFFCSTPFPLGQYLEARTEVKGKLKSGGSVATAAWDFIRTAGCSPIYCAGLDLAFPGRQTHYKGSTFEERVHTFSHRFQPGENAGWQALYSGNPYRVQDYEGQSLLTDQRMKIYISWFEKQMIEHHEVRTFNLSGKGVKLEGMPREDISTLLGFSEIRNELDRELEKLSALKPQLRKNQITDAMTELLRELEDLSSLSKQGLEYSTIMEQDGIDQKVMDRLSEIDQKIMGLGGREIAGFFLLPILEGFLADSHKKKTPEEVLHQSSEFYKALCISLTFHLSQLKKSSFNN